MKRPLPPTMQAVQLDAPGGRVVVRQCPVPKPGPGEVLVRMAASPINPSDLAFLMGAGPQKPFPAIPGIEGSGTVVAAGRGLLPRFLVGKRVACAAAPTSGGTWAEYMATPARRCVPLKRGVSLEQGAMLLVNPLTALAFFDIAKRGKHAAIVSTAAASALGRMIVRLGARHGVPIINIVRRQSHVELLHSMGAKYVLNTGDADFSAQLQTLAHQLNATLLLDALAGRQTPQLLRAAPAGSTVVVYGYLAREPSVIEATTFLYEEKELTGFYLPNWLAKKGLFQVLRDTSRVQQLAGTDLQTTVQRRVPLSAAQEALELYQGNMTAGKVLLLANQSDVSNG